MLPLHEVVMAFEEHEVTYLIADISGYTSFVVSHKKAVAHSQMVISELLRTLVDQVQAPVALSRLEGDAVFAYVLKDQLESPEHVRITLQEFIKSTFTSFYKSRKALVDAAICKCPACSKIHDLHLKLIVHSGLGLMSEIGGSTEFAGIDVIIVHRLLKNSTEQNDYLLLTDAAKPDVAFDDGVTLSRGDERYDDIGEIATWTSPVEPFLEGVLRRDPTERASALAYEVLRHEVRKEYAEVATDPSQEFHFFTGRVVAERLGYSDEDIDSVPVSALESFAGTGNPLSLGDIPKGANVVDIGCGAGFDTFLAANRVGPDGTVVGVDMTPEMLAKARAGVDSGGYQNVQIRPGLAEDLPVPDEWADVVISNGVINLCPDKPAVFREIFRVLKPGGCLQIGDILVEKAIPEGAKRNVDLWTA